MGVQRDLNWHSTSRGVSLRYPHPRRTAGDLLRARFENVLATDLNQNVRGNATAIPNVRGYATAIPTARHDDDQRPHYLLSQS
jgi:hypothetical protein